MSRCVPLRFNLCSIQVQSMFSPIRIQFQSHSFGPKLCQVPVLSLCLLAVFPQYSSTNNTSFCRHSSYIGSPTARSLQAKLRTRLGSATGVFGGNIFFWWGRLMLGWTLTKARLKKKTTQIESELKWHETKIITISCRKTARALWHVRIEMIQSLVCKHSVTEHHSVWSPLLLCWCVLGFLKASIESWTTKLGLNHFLSICTVLCVRMA